MSYIDECGGKFDPLSDELDANFWETLHDMRDRCPVLRSDAVGGFVALSRYEDVTKAALDWKTFSSAQGILPVRPANPDLRFMPAEVDPPEHLQYRRFLNPFFTPQSAAKREGQIRRIAVDILDTFTADGHCEFKSQFASLFPGRVIYEGMYDAPAEDYGKVLEWIQVFSGDPKNAVQATEEISVWVEELLASRADSQNPDDFIACVAKAEINGEPLSAKERVELLTTLVIAGLDTSESSIAAAVGYMAANPGLVERMKEGREVIDRAVDEFLRIESPTIALARTATCDVEFHGETIKAGEKVLLYWGAANRDPAQFAKPNDLDLDGPKAAHLGFGWGPHLCIGRHIAKLEIVVAIEEVLRRMPDLRLAPGTEVRYRSGIVRFPETVHVEFTPTPPEMVGAESS